MSGRIIKSVLGAVLLILFLLAGATWCISWFGLLDPLRKAPPLDFATYATSAKTLRENTYKVEGEVVTMLTWSPSGRLVTIGVGKNEVPVLLPTNAETENIEKGQKLRVLVVVDGKGILRAKKVVKS